MAYYANQKTITVHREKVEQNGKKQYLIVYSDRLDQAARTLSPVGLKLYLYLLTNKDEYEKDYSPKHFADIYGVSVESARKAPQNLIDNGYLVPSGGNKLDFYEEPQIKPSISLESLNIEKRYIPQDNGLFIEMSYVEVHNELKNLASEEEIKEFWNNQRVAV